MSIDWDGHDEWTPWGGIRRGVLWGLVAGVALGSMADVIAWYLPLFALNFWLRTAAALMTMWLLFVVVHWASGMAGSVCTAIVIATSLFIVFSQHIVFAVHGVPTRTGVVGGWEWCSPAALAMCNLPTALGMAFGVWMWRDGASIKSLADLLGTRHGM